jgi:cytochrome c553
VKVDPNSVMMSTIAKRLTPEDIRNVASYVQGMR